MTDEHPEDYELAEGELLTATGNKWLSRKLWLTVAFCVTATVLALYLDGTTLQEWGLVVGGVLGAYFGGNVGEHFSQRPERLE
ncbi:MAG: hypothetical protein ACLFVJ_21815 [Persicimonas sp.]